VSRIAFTKMHGLGNDFMVFEAPPGGDPTPAQLRALAERHTGIGFDQALMLAPARRPDARVFYRVFNADGVEVEQCGNGARCIAALLHRRGQAAADRIFEMDSPGGIVRAHVHTPEWVSIDMGVPDFDPRSLPFDAPSEAPSYRLEAGGETVEIGAVSVGNPHAVLRVPQADSAPVARLGPAIEGHARFPRRVNVGFMQILDRGAIRLRVYERGVGETLACGTGACAAVAVGRRGGLLDSEVRVQVRGGELRVNWAGSEQSLWLTGPAQVSFEGHVDL
jgi:diaminopimelate epimerase